MKLTFKCEHPATDNHSSSTVTFETNAVFLPEILTEFKHFLKGCGFYFDGELEIVDDMPQEPSQDENSIVSTNSGIGVGTGVITFGEVEPGITCGIGKVGK